MLRGSGRSEGWNLNRAVAELGKDLPLTQVPLQMLGQGEAFQLVQAIAGGEAHGMRNGGEQREHDPARLSTAGATPAQELEKPLVALGDFLFAHTGGQPFYLLETLKMFRDLELLVPRLAADGTWRLDLDVEMATAVTQERSRRELLPPSVR